MIIAYVDEAGSTGVRLDAEGQPFHYVGALLVPGSKWLAIKADLQKIKAGLPVAVRDHADFEFHGAELFNGTGCWSAMHNPVERLTVYEKCVEVPLRHNAAIKYGRSDKHLLRRYVVPMHPHHVAVWLCLEQVAEYYNARGRTCSGAVGSIVADATSRDLQRISNEVLQTLRTDGPPFGRKVSMARIIDVIHHMDSKQSLHLQLCDLVLYAIRRRDVTGDAMGGIGSRIRRIAKGRTFPY